MYRPRWAPLGLAAAALGTAGLTLATASASTFATRDQLAATPLPAPGKIAFASDRPSLGIPTPAADGSDARIWISASPLTSPLGAPAQLTIEPRGTQDRNPDFSPDGTQVAFASGQPLTATGDPQGATAAIKLIDLRTDAVRTLQAAAAGQDFPAFSPDGAQVAFVAGGSLFAKAAGAGAAAPVDRLADDVEGKPAWSADGRTIYFARAAARGREIWSVGPLPGGPATTEERIVASSDAPGSQGVDNFDPAASPDGTALCYSRTVPNRAVPELARLDLATRAIAPILSDAGDGTVGGDPATAQERCAWSPDGRDVIFTATDGFPATRQGETSNLRLASVAGDALANPFLNGLNDAQHFDGSADWAPAPPGDGGNGGGGGTGTGTGTGSGTGTSTTTPPPPPPVRLTISGLKVSPATWVLGSRLPQVVAGDPPPPDPPATPGRLVRGRCVSPTRGNRRARTCTRFAVGTTIFASTSTRAQVTIGFQRALSGRRVGGRCVAATTRNRRSARCVRYAAAQSLAPIAANRWTGALHFFGRLSRTRRLVAGASYRLVVSARDAAGHRATATGPRFTISQRAFTVSRR